MRLIRAALAALCLLLACSEARAQYVSPGQALSPGSAPTFSTLNVTGNALIAGDVRVGSTASVYWNTRSAIQSPADGQLKFYNNALTDLATIQAKTLITTQTGTTYTLAATDCGTLVRFTNGSAITLTTLNSLTVGCSIAVEQAGAGQITLANGAGATSHSAHSYTKTFGQYAIIGLTVDANSDGSSAVVIISGDGA